jgi:hypothetical protein
MTAAAVPAGMVPLRPARRSLLWIAPVTALTAHQLTVHGFIALGEENSRGDGDWSQAIVLCPHAWEPLFKSKRENNPASVMNS